MKRLEELHNQDLTKVFDGGLAQPEDIRQGQLGNCYQDVIEDMFQDGLAENHTYTVVTVKADDPQGNLVRVYNPWR
eukprot:CAMPEP_0171097050 /NCGR_PEP_ID=MMETSP0766_2-20121228/46810_1 /TAXON_ID=439317 /ORGANISM="Gambierdiscus australes, Strain CAWD 149" /LENGTH=75 /DNA_ID=CAMNT_0011556167 /DNA_START=191 /DNA_END=418 /DNA_ORIENTATION=-